MKRKIKVTIFGLVLVAFMFFSMKAEAAGGISIGESQVSTEMHTGWMIILNERVSDKYDFNFGYITKQDWVMCEHFNCEWHIDEQIFVGVEVIAWDPWKREFGISVGPYWFQNADRVGTANFRIGVALHWRPADWIEFTAHHFSTAGSGQDLMICRDRNTMELCSAYTPDLRRYEQSNDWNTGQDSWLRVGLRW